MIKKYGKYFLMSFVVLLLFLCAFVSRMFYSVNYQNTVFTKERSQDIKEIIYWDNGEQKSLTSRLQCRKIYRILAEAALEETNSRDSDVVGQRSMDIHYRDGSVLGIELLSDMIFVSTGSSDGEEQGYQTYTTREDLLEPIYDIIY